MQHVYIGGVEVAFEQCGVVVSVERCDAACGERRCRMVDLSFAMGLTLRTLYLGEVCCDFLAFSDLVAHFLLISR